LSVAEIAEVISAEGDEVKPATIEKDLKTARAWLFKRSATTKSKGDNVRDREDLVDELFAEASDIEPSLRAKFFAARRAEYDSLLTEGVFDEVSALLKANDYAQEKAFCNDP
jgi:hypothetical protein